MESSRELQSTGNPWKKREMVLETFGAYPRKVKFHIFGDRVDNIHLEPGRDYVLSCDLESREFNGRWYTDVNVYQARDYMAPVQNPAPQMPSYGAPQQPAAPAFGAPATQFKHLPHLRLQAMRISHFDKRADLGMPNRFANL